MPPSIGATGGVGSSAWPGDSTQRAAGGGGAGRPGPGGSSPCCNGGIGGQSQYANVQATAGATNTGSGGGAAGGGCPGVSGAGGPGVVLIQFPNAFACKGITGGSPACGSPTPGCTHTHTFNATGCFVIPY